MTKDIKTPTPGRSLMPRAEQNKYELVIVAAREARHLNELSRITGEPLPGKVTTIAITRVLDEEVTYSYEEPEPEPESEPLPPAEA